ncbi:MAG: PAS-domain containing protein, partial [Burkholderiales bacterium]
MRALFGVAKTAYATSLAAAAILLAILWGPFTADVLLAWFGALLALTLGRAVLHRSYLRDAAPREPQRWEARFALGAIAAGAMWTIPPAVFFPEGEPLLQMAVMFVVGGTLIGATGVYAPSPAAFYGFSALPFAGVLLQLAQQPGRTYQLLALMALVFGAAMVRVYRDIHGSIVGTLRGQIEKEQLLQRAAGSEAELRDAIESFPEGFAVYDPEDRLLVCNESYASVYGAGKHAAELPGTPYADIARNAYDAEVIPPEFAAPREQWLEGRLARRRAREGATRQFQLRDGRR